MDAEFIEQQKQVHERLVQLERRIAAVEYTKEMPPEDMQPSLHDVDKMPTLYAAAGDERERDANQYCDGIIPRGKYAGKSHDQIVQSDPSYILWLHRENKATGLGFTPEHVDKALHTITQPTNRRR